MTSRWKRIANQIFEHRQRTPARDGHAGNMPAVATDLRLYAIGDVHGRYDLLDGLLAKIDADAATLDDGRKTLIVLVGDYVDRGEDSAKVLSRVRSLVAEGRAVGLKGNHEEMMLDYANGVPGAERWLKSGGIQTLASYGIGAPAMHDADAVARSAGELREAARDDLDMIRDDLLPMYRSGNVVVVHAAVDPSVSLEEQDARVLAWGLPGFADMDLDTPYVVVHGHTVVRAVEQSGSRIGIDTGAYHSGVLTALRLDGGMATLQCRS